MVCEFGNTVIVNSIPGTDSADLEWVQTDRAE